jgi:hypothetical protein
VYLPCLPVKDGMNADLLDRFLPQVVAALLFAHAFGSYVSQTSPPSPLNVTESTWSSIVLVCLSSVRSVSGDYVLLSQIRHNEAAHTFAGMHTLSYVVRSSAVPLLELKKRSTY